MALDALVDSTQLDADLTSVADAIRTKGGTSAQLAFPAGFVSAINDISGGGGYTADDWLDPTKPTGALTTNAATIPSMIGRTGAFSVSAPNATATAPGGFERCTGMTGFSAPNLTTIKGSFKNTTSWTSAAFLPKAKIETSQFENSRVSHLVCLAINSSNSSICRNNTNLEAFDQIGSVGSWGANCFNGCTKLGVIVLRNASIVPLGNTNNLTNTKFWTGKAGGDIYIPKALYDQLGTGTNDYKAASNWSTIDGYGKTTWHAIEGSYYETHYADGTLIPTT